MLLIFLSCKHALGRMDDYLDRELSARERRWVWAHLVICHACAAKFRFQASFLAALRARIANIEQAQRATMSPDLSAKIALALRQTPQNPAADEA